MIVKEIIHSYIFIEQTTYHIYRNEEERQNGRAFLTTSDKETFESFKEQIRNGNNTIPFVQQTANDYDIDYDVVKRYYNRYGSTPMFYEKLEDFIKTKSNLK